MSIHEIDFRPRVRRSNFSSETFSVSDEKVFRFSAWNNRTVSWYRCVPHKSVNNRRSRWDKKRESFVEPANKRNWALRRRKWVSVYGRRWEIYRRLIDFAVVELGVLGARLSFDIWSLFIRLSSMHRRSILFSSLCSKLGVYTNFFEQLRPCVGRRRRVTRTFYGKLNLTSKVFLLRVESIFTKRPLIAQP